MKIDRLKIDGFATLRDLDLHLERLNLLTAPMGFGKSTVLNATSYAIQGHTRLGKLPSATAQMVPSESACVSVELDDGFSWSRAIQKGRKGVSQSISGVSDGDSDEQNVKLAIHVGEFAEAHDLNELMSLSPDKKRDRLLELIGKARDASGNPLDRKSIAGRVTMSFFERKLGEATVHGIGEVWPGTPDELRTHLAGKLAAADRDAFKGAIYPAIIAALSKPAPLEEQVGAMVDAVNDIKNGSKKKHDECQQAVNALTARKAALTPSAKTVEQLTTERDGLLRERESAHAAVKVAEGKASELAAARSKLTDLQARADRDAATVAGLVAPTDPSEADHLDRKAAELATQVESLGDVEAPVRAARAAYDAASDKFDATGTPATKAGDAMAAAQRKVKTIRGEIESLAGSPWQTALGLWEDFILTIPDLQMPAGVRADNTKRTCDRLDTFLREQAKLDYRDKLTADLKLAMEAAETATAAFNAIEAERKAAYAAWQDQTPALNKARAEADAQMKARREALAEIDTLRSRASDIRSQAESHARRLADATARKNRGELDVQEAERAVMQLEREAAPAALMDARNRYADIDARVSDIDNAIKAKVGFDSLVKELTATIATKEEQGVLHEVAKVALECTREIRDRLVGELVSPLLDRMNRFLAIAAPGCRAYCNLAGTGKKTVFELGWIKSRPGKPDMQVPLNTLSGGESVIYSAALVYAMTMMADPPLKLMLLEVAEVDEWNWNNLAAALEAVADELGNILVATSRVFPVRDGWNVIGRSVFAAERELVTA